MKNVGLLTLDSQTYNYGGILQEYALCKILENFDTCVEIIDFDLSSEIYTFSYKRSLLNLNLEKILSKLRNKISANSRIDISEEASLRHKAFDAFRKSYLKLSKPYTAKSISKATTEYDTLVCGSDQIWNPDFNVPEFFLNFASEGQKRVIYGASLGRDELTKRQKQIYKKLMSHLDYISVREDKAREILQPISDTYIEVVLDPTLLIKPEDWSELASTTKEINSEYIFCYFLDNNEKNQKAAKMAAQEMGLKIATIPYLHDVYEKTSECFGDYKFLDIGPREFLGLIRNAKLVMTDSFHATVFSILFKKDFWTFGRDCGSYNMDSRIVTLLKYFDLSDRLIETDLINFEKSCEYSECCKQFEMKRQSSILFLKNAIS